MEILGRVSRKNRQRDKLSLSQQCASESKLQFYQIPPTGNISLQEFEDIALERLKVLKAVETVGLRGLKDSDDYRQALQKELRSIEGPVARCICRTDCDPDDKQMDHVSHFILRLAYCRTEELQRWFIAQELDLFRYRFHNEKTDNIQRFLDATNLKYTPISLDEKEENRKNLTFSISGHMLEHINFYKVPFSEAFDLVQRRQVYIHLGLAFVPHSDLVILVINKFRSHLSCALKVASRAFPNLEEDDRLLPMLLNLSKRYVSQDYNRPASGQVTCEMVDALSRTSFPLCMLELHHNLRHTHHLRHSGRRQYGLFLKGVGLSLDEALRFWRTEFTKIIDADKFDKQYSYNIRHSYGKEGKRVDYSPHSCVKIITTNAPALGDYHGCPYRHADISLVRQKLQALQISDGNIEEILTPVRAGHFQLACGKCFEVTHKTDVQFSPNHPNEYYEMSRATIDGAAGSQSKASSQPAAPPAAKPAAPPKSEMNADDSLLDSGDFDDEIPIPE